MSWTSHLWDQMRTNADYLRYRVRHPFANFERYYVSSLRGDVHAGRPHNTLGTNHKDPERFAEVGARLQAFLWNEAGLSEDSCVVDYGCGSLRVGRHFIRVLDPGCYVGLDVDPTFYTAALDELGPELLERKRPLLAPIHRRSLREAARRAPDLVYSTAVLHHVAPRGLARFFSRVRSVMSDRTLGLANFRPGEATRQEGSRAWSYESRWLLERVRQLDFEVDLACCPEVDGWYDRVTEGVFLRFRRRS